MPRTCPELTGELARAALVDWLALPSSAMPACTPDDDYERPGRDVLEAASRAPGAFPSSNDGVFFKAARTLHLSAGRDGWRISQNEQRTIRVLP
jgi:hypothetical protein